LNYTDFSSSELAGVCLDNLTFKGTTFHYSGLRGTSFRNAIFHGCSFKTDVKKAIFDGAKMDKMTYVLLVERRAAEPIISLAMFKNRLYATSNAVAIFAGQHLLQHPSISRFSFKGY
jgi:hypothetical protein